MSTAIGRHAHPEPVFAHRHKGKLFTVNGIDELKFHDGTSLVDQIRSVVGDKDNYASYPDEFNPEAMLKLITKVVEQVSEIRRRVDEL